MDHFRSILKKTDRFLKVSNRFVKNWLQYGALPKSLQNCHISSAIWIDSETNMGNTKTYTTGTFRPAACNNTTHIRRYAGSSVQHSRCANPTGSLLILQVSAERAYWFYCCCVLYEADDGRRVVLLLAEVPVLNAPL